MRSAFLYTVLWLFWFLPSAVAAPQSWSFEDYLAKFLNQDETYLQAQLQTKDTVASNQSFFDLYQNTLTFQPSWNQREQDNAFGLFDQERVGLEGSISQQLPLGTNLSFSTLKFLDDPNPAIGGLDMQYDWSAEQSLWRDAFGIASRNFRRSAEASIKSVTYAEKQSLMDSCLQATQAYLESFVRQEQKKLRQQIFTDAEKALGIAKRGYRRRVLRKIDFLAARSDFLKVKADLLADLLFYEQAMSTFYTRVAATDSPQSATLSSPENFFSKVPVPKVYDPEKVVQLLQAREDEVASRLSYKATKSNNRSAANLGVSGRHQEILGATAAGGGAFSLTEIDTVQVYLRLELPLINRTASGETESRFYQWKISQLNQQRLKKDLKNQFRRLQLEQEKLKSEIDLTKENEVVKKQQLKEADRLLQSGKIEFADYVRYRDSFYAEKQKLINLRSSLWQGLMQLAQYSDQLGVYCRGAQRGTI